MTITPLDIVIDISRWQGVPDWTHVAAAGIKLAFIKAVEGSSVVDKSFAANKAGATAVGIHVVPYDFLRGTSVASVAADFFANTAGLSRGTPFMLDWEGRASDTCTALTTGAIGSHLTTLTGRTPVGYWGMPGSTPAQPTQAMAAWDRFVPRYPQVPQPPSYAALTSRSVSKLPLAGSLFVQYSSAGRVSGIVGDVDRSVWLGTLAELDAWYRDGTRPATA